MRRCYTILVLEKIVINHRHEKHITSYKGKQKKIRPLLFFSQRGRDVTRPRYDKTGIKIKKQD